ncbi:hypothetical protein AC1031_020632 [Aphanomyces cochlioides]|nr:hypothetical protein AC1031_020632 [Aphanomyces cochlioides]
MDNLNQLDAQTIRANLSKEGIEQQFVAGHAFIGTLERLVSAQRMLMDEVLGLRGLISGLVESNRQQYHALERLCRSNQQIREESLVSGCPQNDQLSTQKRMVMLESYRSWPKDFHSLANIRLSSLIVKYLVDSLYDIPLEPNNKVQHKVKQAIAIASKFYPVSEMRLTPSSKKPSPAVYNDWCQIANDIQRSVIRHIQAHRPQISRNSAPKGFVEGILKLWSKLNLDSVPVNQLELQQQ